MTPWRDTCAILPRVGSVETAEGVGVRPRGVTALRLAVLLAVLVAGAFLATSALATGGTAQKLPALNHQVLAAVNRFRVGHGLVPLRESAALDRSARQHSLEMGREGFFGHSSANGTVFWRRIQHYYAVGDSSYWAVGENLLWASPDVSAVSAMKMWIASPPHLKNLLATRWRQIGVSAVTVPHASGAFEGRRVTIITTDFGVRR